MANNDSKNKSRPVDGPRTLGYSHEMLCKALESRLGLTHEPFSSKPREIAIIGAVDLLLEQNRSLQSPLRIDEERGWSLKCERCSAQVLLPYEGVFKTKVDIFPASGWELYPHHLCPKCLTTMGDPDA